MTGEIKSGYLLLHRHLLHRGELRNFGDGDRLRLGVRFIAASEEVELPGDVVAFGAGDAVYDLPCNLEQGLALVAHAVERTRADKAVNGAAVKLLAAHPAAEVLKAFERTAMFALAHKLLNGAPTDALYCDKAEADIFAGDGEVCVGLVHVRREKLNTHLAAGGNVLCDLCAVVKYRGQQRRHVLARVVALHVGCAVNDNRIAHGVRLVEGVACKVKNFVVYAVCDILAHAVCERAGDIARGVTVHEGNALGVDDLVLLLAHRAAYHVGLTE